ncbi:MAG TPA: ABC-2 family transporter protein [Actinomycetota bacterium]|nr:ABC-2 family transporter protein [Actinomycetota bacterium]
MGSTLGIYRRIGASRVRAQAQYRLSLGLQVCGTFLFAFMDFVMILILFTHFSQLAGWSLGEIAFLYGTSYMPFRGVDVLMTNMDQLPTHIRLGTFDQVLTRPLGSLGQILTGDLDVRHVGGMVQGALVLAYALAQVSIDWTPTRVLVLASMILSAVVIFGAVWVATNSIAFWTTDGREVANTFTYGGNYVTNYPIHIFGRWLRRVLTFGIPLAFVNYYPSLYVLGRRDVTEAPSWFPFLSPVAAIVVSIVAGMVWRVAVRHYRSTGS